MPVARLHEREVTYEVGPDWSVPDLSSLVPDGGRVATETHTLEATYYDTEASTLRLLGISLRHRRGGPDAGWHLKVPSGDGRTEVHSRAAGTSVPAALSRRIAGVAGTDPLRPVATIRTTRQASDVLSADGQLVVEVADDRVVGSREDGAAAPVEWREVEVELGPAGKEADLDRVAELLAGARPASVQRKITHVLGEPATRELDGLPGLVAGYVREQCRAVLVGDVRLRDDPSPEAVHRTRVALRRLRSTLRLFPDAVADVPEGFDDDLRWFAGLLSPVRDSDILQRRLRHELGEIDPVDVVGPVGDEVRRALRTRREATLAELRRTWDDERYRRLLATLVQWYAWVPVREDVRLRPRKALRTARRKVARRVATAEGAPGLHRARKAAKRLRYAGDLLAPKVPGARKAAKKGKRLQTRLGDHQDLVVATAFVRNLAESSPVRNGFTYGVLAARFDCEAEEIRRSL